jgi:hypothetical protein
MSGGDGILSRWSSRKAQARSGTLPAEAKSAPVRGLPPQAGATPTSAGSSAVPPAADALAPSPLPTTQVPSPPTLADVAALTADADFSRFVMPGVDEGVKHAAMKKLFADPHFNVMDGLDTYIDDYGKPDPIPEAMLRRMTQSKFLRLFDEEPAPPEAGAAVLPGAQSGDAGAALSPVQTDAAPPGDAALAPDEGPVDVCNDAIRSAIPRCPPPSEGQDEERAGSDRDPDG